MRVVMPQALPHEPLSALRALSEGAAELARLRQERVRTARAAGATWGEIGEALGMSRQSAWEFFTAPGRRGITEAAERNAELDEGDALQLAVDEVREIRRRPRH